MSNLSMSTRLFTNGMKAVSKVIPITEKSSQILTNVFDKEGKLVVSRMKRLVPGSSEFRSELIQYPISKKGATEILKNPGYSANTKEAVTLKKDYMKFSSKVLRGWENTDYPVKRVSSAVKQPYQENFGYVYYNDFMPFPSGYFAAGK